MTTQTKTDQTFTWHNDAACTGPEVDPLGQQIFYEYSGKADIAKRICDNCSVLQNCLDWALTEPGLRIHMVLGGLTLAERIDTAEQMQIAA